MAKYQPGPYREVKLSFLNRGAIDYLDASMQNHLIRGLVEIDVTDIRSAIRRYRRKNSKSLSLTAYMVFIYARAIASNPGIQKLRKGWRKAVEFEDVDISVMMEKKVHGEARPTVYIVRKAHSKSLAEIEAELSSASSHENKGVFTDSSERNPAAIFERLPRIVRRTILKYVLRYRPHFRKQIFGTASFSSVGMFGNASGWGIPLTSHAIHFVIGGIGKKPRFIKGELQNRELLHATLSVDHDFIDGAPGARFAYTLFDMAENLYGLEDHSG